MHESIQCFNLPVSIHSDRQNGKFLFSLSFSLSLLLFYFFSFSPPCFSFSLSLSFLLSLSFPNAYLLISVMSLYTQIDKMANFCSLSLLVFLLLLFSLSLSLLVFFSFPLSFLNSHSISYSLILISQFIPAYLCSVHFPNPSVSLPLFNVKYLQMVLDLFLC